MTAPVRSEKLEMRVSPEAKRLLREAAELRHKTMSEFVLDSALAAAEETVLQRRILRLGEAEWQAFVEALDAPPLRHARMEQLLTSPGVFD
ncbi:type II toxin-antitoxin system TacA family antitoxin [Pannonibacter sp. Q-1]|jgi:uncharacterized protein (DUF1778 family)|uniref:Uncharacterized protein n=2 Tax=Pannonibacter TaxID=227873 RepID=A0A0L0ISX3_9HYPH|nr:MULTISPECIES: DUF1778 domain-containing protein [Pannonibacter]ALV30516.1 hypothetical protein APZ00_25140 [Pannonibacter phragmitetus]KND16294.1 hypothetical protein ADZ37_23975 [Pannonibacter phragmitetus]CUA99188.1 Uncharacterized conserved protein, DUF1778 family [Pannonibacter indicus]